MKILINKNHFYSNYLPYLFCLSYFCYLLSQLLDLSFLAHGADGLSDVPNVIIVINLFKKISALFLLLIILLTRYKKKWFWLYYSLAAVSCIVLIVTENKDFAYLVLFMLGAYSIPSRYYLKLAITLFGAFLLLFPLLSLTGIFPDYYVIESGRVRHFLGFTYTTHSATLSSFFIFVYLYLRFEKIKSVDYIGLIAISVFFYYCTRTRMPFFVALITILIHCCFKQYFSHKNSLETFFSNRVRRTVLCVLPFLFFLIAFVIHYYYSPSKSFFVLLNDILNNRLKLGHQALTEYGLPLFGSQIKLYGYRGVRLEGVTYNYVDSSYIQIILKYGLIFLLLILSLYSRLIYIAFNNRNYTLLVIIIMILVLAISDPRLIDLRFNPFVLMITSYGLSGLTNTSEKRNC